MSIFYHQVEKSEKTNSTSVGFNKLELDLEDARNPKNFTRHFGNYITCKFTDGEPWIAIGPHWPLFICSFSGLIFLGVMVLKLVTVEDFKYFIITLVISVLQLSSFLYVALKNPGIASSQFPVSDITQTSNQRFCEICNIVRQQGTSHCEDCNVCIENLDHHCPWTGQCIGEGNINSFHNFLILTFIFMIYSIITALSKTQ